MKILLAPDSAGGGTAVAAPPAPAAPAKATPAPAAPSAPAKPAPSQPSGDDAFSRLDQRAAKPKEKPAPKPTEPKPGEPPAPKPPEPAPGLPPAADLKDPRRLRSAYELKSQDLDRTRKELNDMQARLEQAEARGKDTTQLAERVAAMEKEKEALQSQLRAFKQEASPEFQEKYETPIKEASDYAKQIIEKLEITERNEAGDELRTRPATWEDFIALYTMPLNRAVKLANTMFGEAAQTVINHLTEIQRLDFNKKRALDRERAKAKENEEREKTEATTRKEAIAQMWQRYNRDLIESHPDWQAAPDDKEGAEILKEGYATVDTGLHGKDMTIEKKVLHDANIRNRAAVQPYFAHKLKLANERIAELEGIIAEKNGSMPGPTNRGGGAEEPGKPLAWNEELRKLKSEMEVNTGD